MRASARQLVWIGVVCAGTAAAGSVPERAVTDMDIELLGDTLAPNASAFAPGVVAWVEPGEQLYQVTLEENGQRRVVEFWMPTMLGGGAGIAVLGYRTDALPAELCVLTPDIRCAAAPRSASNTERLQVGNIDGDVAVWFTDDFGVDDLFRLTDEGWQEVPLPDIIHRGGRASVPSSGDGFQLSYRGSLTRWTRRDGAWTSESQPQGVLGCPAVSDTQMLVYDSGPLQKPSGELILHDNRPPAPGTLSRIPLDGGAISTVTVDVGHLSLLLLHGEEGALLVGSHQAEYWQGGERRWQLPSTDMSGASWAGHPWVSIGSTRMRLDSTAIVVEDPIPGRFLWSERITPELVTCGSGHGLKWQHDETVWYAWMKDDHVQIGHDCPEQVDPWPPGQITGCAWGNVLEADDMSACVAVRHKPYSTPKSMVLLTRRTP